MKVSNATILTQDEHVFIISVAPMDVRYPVYYIPTAVFEPVEDFVDKFYDGFKAMIETKCDNGNVEYWEENYHDRIVELLLVLLYPRFAAMDKKELRQHISNSLSALGF